MSSEAVRGLTKGALSFFSGTFLSRITGLIRDVSMAFFFGSHPALAAFMVAYRLANLFRRLLGEGPLPSGFVPHFELIRKESPQDGARFFRDVFFSLFFLLIGVLCLSEVGLLALIKYSSLAESAKEILHLTFLMMPGILFICLYGISSALLQCEKKFFFPSMAPSLFNVVWILSVFLFRNSIPSEAVLGLSLAVVLGFFVQWVFLAPLMKNYLRALLGWKEIFSFRFFSSEVKAVIKPFLFGLIGVASTQINSALDAVFARYASLEGPAYLWFAIRIEQLPIALFGIALSSALLPPLSRAIAAGNWTQFKELMRFSLTRTFSFIFPCSVALFALASSGVNLLYGRGDFSMEATSQTIYCLWGYGLGLIPAVLILLMAPAFYSQKDFKTPMRASALSVAINVFLNALFVFAFDFGAFSIALSTSIASWFNFLVLARALRGRNVWEAGSGVFKSLYKTAACSLFAGGVAIGVGYFLVDDQTISIFVKGMVSFPRVILRQLVQFLTLSGVFIFTFIAAVWVCKVEDVLLFLGMASKKGLVKE